MDVVCCTTYREIVFDPLAYRPRPPAGRRGSDVLGLLILVGIALLLMQWAYRPMRTVTITMDAPRVLLQYQGLYPQERFANSDQSYRWTNGDGLLRLPNLGGKTHREPNARRRAAQANAGSA